MEVAKKDLTEYLNTPFHTYKRWSEERLKEELLRNCWKVTDIYKQGRNKIFVLEYEEQNFDVVDYVENEFNVRNGDKFMEHTSARVKSIQEDKPMSATQISEKINISKQTSYNYDSKLEEKGIIQKTEDSYYIVKNKKTKEVAITTKEAYMNFWSINRAVKKELSDLYNRLERKEISPKDYDYLTDKVKDSMQSDYYYYEVSRWVLDESNTTYQVIKEFLI